MPYGEFSLEHAERLELKGGHGEYRATHVAGDAEVVFKSGSARVGRVDGTLRLTGVRRRASRSTRSHGPAELATSSGGIDLGTARSGATVRAAYGMVRIRDAVRGTVQVDSSYGTVDVGVRHGTAVWLDATSEHGVVRTDLAADSGPSEGEETLELRIRAGYASINVHRSEASVTS